MLTAIKYWEDKYFWNIDVVNKLKIFDLRHTNLYEHLFLELIKFNLAVTKEEFDRYFKLLTIYKKNNFYK